VVYVQLHYGEGKKSLSARDTHRERKGEIKREERNHDNPSRVVLATGECKIRMTTRDMKNKR